MSRILFVSHMSRYGGPTESLVKLLRYIRHEHEVAVLAPGDGYLFDLLAQMDIPHYQVSDLTVRTLPAMARLIHREDFKLVYANNFSSGTRNAVVAAKLAHANSIWHIREMLYAPRKRNVYFLRWPEHIVAVSEACAQLLRQYATQERICVVPNGIEPEEFDLDSVAAREAMCDLVGATNEDIIVLSVGYISTRKGQEYAVAAASRLAEKHPRMLFVLVGSVDTEPNYVERLKNKIEEEGAIDRVRILGFHNNVPLLLCGADIFLHTALEDPNPRAVIEAMAAGLPVVAFGVDGVSELVVQGETGYTVAARDVVALTEHLVALRDDPDLRVRLGQAGRALVQTTYLAEQTAAKINAIITNLGP